ncbi:hypothetical protein G6M85_21115 [Agrobacterium tumefaciens]|uniref:hypothetical protein n=1 Tax=Agrobacterium tumefaciens TaxID=358 RepID=UPI0015746A2C|nr:hypothetical protein [Agrobacterium tumefaciens]NTE68108.1 hypothetical protein [Agrobacterium tumefaciens]
MNDIAYQRLRIRADAGWRHVVRVAVCQLDRRIRSYPKHRFARKRFYRSMLAAYRAD